MRLMTCALLVLLTISYASSLPGQTPKHRFSVQDSIEMTTFSDPDQIEVHPKVSFSPDGSKFLIVTSRGEIATDEVHSDLLMYDVPAVEQYLQGKTLPHPLRLASIAAIPQAFTYRSYAPLITELHWSQDSGSVYYLGQESDGSRRLYRVTVASLHPRTLSPAGIDVRQFTVNSQNAVAFYGGPTQRATASYASLSGDVINRDARSVTGLSLPQILFPEADNGATPRIDSLWFISATGAVRKVATDQELGGPTMESPSALVLSLSPDGHHVICILPLEKVPESWKNFDPMPIFEMWRIDPKSPAQTSVFNATRPRSYFLIDTQTGRRTQLIDAPNSGPFGYHDRSMVAWSSRGDHVLVTDTFLPFLENDGKTNHPHLPCAAARVNLHSNASECIVASRDRYQGKADGANGPLQLTDAHFDNPSEDSVSLEFGYNNEDVSVTEHYAYHPAGWMRLEVHDSETSEEGIAVYVRQDLNTPPTLWAKDGASQAKELLDPNPQMRQIQSGKASVYRWIDQTGRKWEGGLVLPVDYQPSEQYPLVIQTHGFKPSEFLVDGGYPTAMAARPLASVGIVVLQMGYIYDHVLTPQELDDQLLGYQSAIEHLVDDGIVDRKRVGIIGFSRPAWHVEAAIEKAPEVFAAATIADGTDMGYMQYLVFGEGNRPLAVQFERTNGGQPFGEGISHWLNWAVPFHLDQVRTPLRIEAIGPASLIAEWEDYSSSDNKVKPSISFTFRKGSISCRIRCSGSLLKKGMSNGSAFGCWITLTQQVVLPCLPCNSNDGKRCVVISRTSTQHRPTEIFRRDQGGFSQWVATTYCAQQS